MLTTPVLGAGTPANTQVTNTASVAFVIGGSGVAQSVNSNPASFRVDERLDVAVVSNNAAPVAVLSPDNDRPLSYTVTNLGNGAETFRLVIDTALGGDQFDPSDTIDARTRVYLDTNANGSFEPAIDTPYVAGTNDPLLAPDQSVTVFVTHDIPAGRAQNDLGLARLTARALTGTGAAGTVFAGQGTGGTDAVIGATTASADRNGSYQVATVSATLAKSQAVADPQGGTNPVSGATVTYTLTLAVSGSGTVTAVQIVDAIPANTSYVAGSLRLNGSVLTDGVDADAGRFTGSQIEVTLGALSAPSTQTVAFQARIN
jgi:uncharacterized repeat protein (TIGR01451 family)